MDNFKTVFTAEKISESRIRIRSNDTGAEMEMSEYFSFFAEGYQFMPLYKNKMWNGKIYLYDMKTHTIPFGLMGMALRFCSERGYDITPVGDFKTNYPKAEDVLEYIKTVPLTTRGKPIVPHEYQRNAVSSCMESGRGILISPTGSGKSLMIYLMLRTFAEQNPGEKMLLVVPLTSLVEQMVSDFADYSETDSSFDVSKVCHKIYAGKEKTSSLPITVTTWQSAASMPPEWFKNFSMVIGDEAHLFKAKSLAKIMDGLVNARVRIGTTGTLDGSKINELSLIGSFGPIYKATTTKELMDSDILAQCSIECLVLKYSEEFRKSLGKMDYQKELDTLVSLEPRNNFITNLSVSLEGNTLVLFSYVEKHGKPLFSKISSKAGAGRKVFYVSGEVETTVREEIRGIVEKETDAIIVAGFQVFSTGVNIRNLHNIIFASPTKSQIKVLQSIGRGLRKSDNGKGTVIYDIGDDLSHKKRKNYTLNHAIERVKIYTKEKFKFKVHEVKMTL